MLPESSGIYIIVNKENDKCYIGQSVNMRRRQLHHIRDLNKGTHDNIYLQRAWDKYGKSCFEFNVLELCDERLLNEFEIEYIKKYDSYNNGYNLTIGGLGHRGYKLTDQQLKTKRESMTSRIPKIVLLNTGEIFDFISDAAKCYGVDSTSICGCCHGNRLSAGDLNGDRLVWSFYDDYIKLSEIEIKEKINRAKLRNKGSMSTSSKSVVLLNNEMVFGSITEAATFVGSSATAISGACRGKRKTAGVYNGDKCVWCFYDNFINMTEKDKLNMLDSCINSNFGKNHFHSKEVILVNTGEHFGSMMDASRKYNVDNTKISLCCLGQRKSAGSLNGEKMIWKFA